MRSIIRYIIFLSIFFFSKAIFGMKFLIENPFDKKQEDDVQLRLDVSVAQENGFFAESGEKRDCVFDKGQNDLVFESPANVITHALPKRQLKKKKRKRYVDVFNKNEDGEFECPYNCPENYAHNQGKCVIKHIKARHDSTFDLQTFNPTIVNLDAWIPRKKCGYKKKKYEDVFEKNENGEFECSYNCLNDYSHKEGRLVITHIKARHDKDFDLQTFDPRVADLNVWIPRGRRKRYADVFEKNEDGRFVCPYNCPENYAHNRGDIVIKHIKARHDKKFDLKTFDLNNIDLDIWVSRKKKWGNKNYNDVFEKNKEEKFECPYHCPDNYAYKDGRDVVSHIKRRHDPGFSLQTFDPDEVDLDAWIPRKKTGFKRKRFLQDVDTGRKKKKRKFRI